MGQKISALRRKVRSVKEDDRCKSAIDGSLSRSESECAALSSRVIGSKDDSQLRNNIDGSLSQITSSEEECTVLSSNMIESVQSSIIRASSEDPHRFRESEIETIPEGLLKFSTELILEIADYLPPSSYMSLSYSCRRIRNGMSASIEHVLGNKLRIGQWSASAPSIEMRNIRSLERLEWRQMLDRDRKVPSPRAFCSRCSCTHDRSLFSMQSLTQPSTERRCLGSAGRLWICPYRSLDYDQAIGFLTSAKNHFSTPGRFYWLGRSPTPEGSFIIFWPILKMPQDGVPSNQEVEEALRSLKAPMCPHLRLNDACVASTYLKDCGRLQHEFWIWKTTTVCRFCHIEIRFIVRKHLRDPVTLNLVVLRRIEFLQSCTDRTWIRYVADPADLKEYEDAWHAANVECRRRLGPRPPY